MRDVDQSVWEAGLRKIQFLISRNIRTEVFPVVFRTLRKGFYFGTVRAGGIPGNVIFQRRSHESLEDYDIGCVRIPKYPVSLRQCRRARGDIRTVENFPIRKSAPEPARERLLKRNGKPESYRIAQQEGADGSGSLRNRIFPIGPHSHRIGSHGQEVAVDAKTRDVERARGNGVRIGKIGMVEKEAGRAVFDEMVVRLWKKTSQRGFDSGH